MNIFKEIREGYSRLEQINEEEFDLSDALFDLDQWAMNNNKIAVSDVLENALEEHECDMYSDLVNQYEDAAAALYKSTLALAKNFGYKGERILKESIDYTDSELSNKLIKMYNWSMTDDGNKKVTQMLERSIKGLSDHFKDEFASIILEYVEKHRHRAENLYKKSVKIMDEE